MENKKKVDVTANGETEGKEISLEKLDEVVGGGAFDSIPRVPTKPIDDSVKDKI